MSKFPTPDPIAILLDIAAGDIRIAASDTVESVVTVVPKNAANPADIAAAKEATIDFSGGRLVVRTARNWKQYVPFLGPFGGDPAVDVTISVPAGSRVEGGTGLGIIHCDGALGDCRLETGAGAIIVRETAAATLKTGFGDISATLVVGHLNAETGSGEIEIGTVRGSADVRSSNGTIRLETVEGDLQAKTANGRVSVDVARGSVRVKTANGAVQIGSVERGLVEIDTAAGEIDVGIREGTAAWLDLNTPNGNVRNALDTVGEPTATDETVEVRAHTSFGDIVIRRAADIRAFAEVHA